MKPPKNDLKKLTYYTGKVLRIVFAETLTGHTHGRDYLDSVKLPDWGKLDRVLKRLGDHGEIRNEELFRSVGDKLWEVKGGPQRLLGYFKAGFFIITHGFRKRGGGKAANRFPDNERDRALRIMDEFDGSINKL